MHARILSFAFLSSLLLGLTGCELLPEPDLSLEVAGRVVLAETGEPIPGLSVTLHRGGSFGSYPIVQRTQTDADGRFVIRHDPPHDQLPFPLRINADPYDARYTVSGGSVLARETLDLGTVELSRNETP